MTIATLTAIEYKSTLPTQAEVFITLLEENGGALPLDLLCELAKEKLTTCQTAAAIFNHYHKRLFAANGYVTLSKPEYEAKVKKSSTTATGLTLAPITKKTATAPKISKADAKVAAFFAKSSNNVTVKHNDNVAANMAKQQRARLEQSAALI